MINSVLLPIAEVNISPVLLICIGFSIGLIAGIYGIGGGIIAVPVLIFIGIPTEIAVVTAINQMTAASFSGYLAYARRERVDYKLSSVMITGSFLGVMIGVYIFIKLRQYGYEDLLVNIGFLILLIIVSFFSAKNLFISFYYKYRKTTAQKNYENLLFYNFHFLQTHYKSTKQPLSLIFPWLLGIIGGILTATMGTSGSLIMLPVMLYLLKISTKYIAGTVHFQMIFTTILATLLYSLKVINLDLILSMILIIGTVFGTQIGARIGTRFDKETYKITLSVLILMLCFKVSLNLFSKPKNPYILEIQQKDD